MLAHIENYKEFKKAMSEAHTLEERALLLGRIVLTNTDRFPQHSKCYEQALNNISPEEEASQEYTAYATALETITRAWRIIEGYKTYLQTSEQDIFFNINRLAMAYDFIVTLNDVTNNNVSPLYRYTPAIATIEERGDIKVYRSKEGGYLYLAVNSFLQELEENRKNFAKMFAQLKQAYLDFNYYMDSLKIDKEKWTPEAWKVTFTLLFIDYNKGLRYDPKFIKEIAKNPRGGETSLKGLLASEETANFEPLYIEYNNPSLPSEPLTGIDNIFNFAHDNL